MTTLQDRLRRFKIDRSGYAKYCHQAADHIDAQDKRIAELEAQYDQLEVAMSNISHTLFRIEDWCAAYPIEVFTEPNWAEVKEKLGSTLLTQVSAANMRHVVTGIQKIIDEGRKP